MEKYILELIPKNNRVIVPDFGAFIVSRDAGITVLFNNFLSFNDGLLLNHVSRQAGIDDDAAGAKISEYVDRVKQQLNENGEYTIEGLGMFTRDKSGILRFTQSPVVAQLFKDEPPETSNEAGDSELLDIDTRAEEPPPAVEERDEEEKTGEGTPPVPGFVPEDEPLLTLDGSEAKSGEEVSEQKVAGPLAEPMVAAPPTTGLDAPPLTPVASRRKTLLPPWAIGLIIIIPIAIVLLYFFFWNQSDSGNAPERAGAVTQTIEQAATDDPASPAEPVEDDAGAGTPVAESTEPEPAPAQPAATHTQNQSVADAKPRPYHIIVGSFTSEANARKKVNAMQTQGFSEAIHFTNRGMHVVSILSFNTLKEAQAAQEDVINRHKMENWVLRKR